MPDASSRRAAFHQKSSSTLAGDKATVAQSPSPMSAKAVKTFGRRNRRASGRRCMSVVYLSATFRAGSGDRDHVSARATAFLIRF